jgi:putative transposase
VWTARALIQALIPLGLKAVGEALNDEGTARPGGPVVPSQRRAPWGGPVGPAAGLGRPPGPAVTYQRVWDRRQHTAIPLPPDQQLPQPRAADTGRFRTGLEGRSCRRYAAGAEAVPAAFGLSPSTGSRRCIRASAATRRARGERRLEGDDVVALRLDGTPVAEDAILIALGLTRTGAQVLLGVVPTAAEHAPVSATFLRGLRYAQGLLVSMGPRACARRSSPSSGPRPSCSAARGTRASMSSGTCRRVSRPRGGRRSRPLRPTYAEATAALRRLRRTLTLVNESAVRSLDEGREETLTLGWACVGPSVSA